MIRYFQEKDIEQIYNLGNELTYNFSKTNHLIELLTDKFTKILVYEEKGLVKGFLMYTELEETIDILDIYVRKEYRNQRIGSCLLDTLISNMGSRVKLLTLEVRKNNLPAISFYKKFGFEIVNIRKKYYKSEDAYLMGRRIER